MHRTLIHLLPTEPIEDRGVGFPIVLLPGNQFNITPWNVLIENLSRSYRITIPRLPFHNCPLSITRRTDVSDYLEHFVFINLFNQIVLIGSGTGADAALHFTSRYPEKVHKLILTKAFHGTEVEPGYAVERTKHAAHEQCIKEQFVQQSFSPSMIILEESSLMTTQSREFKYKHHPSYRITSPTDILGIVQEFLLLKVENE